MDSRLRRHGCLGRELLLDEIGGLARPGIVLRVAADCRAGDFGELRVQALLEPPAAPRHQAFKSSTIPRSPRDFVPVWQRGFGEEDSSFPSGHAAMGFYLMAPAFVCYRRRPWLAAGFLLLGLACGGVIGLARIVAGCHFPSDVLWAGGIIYFTALAAGRAVSVWTRESDGIVGGDSSRRKPRNLRQHRRRESPPAIPQNSNSIRSSPKSVLGKMARAVSSPIGSSAVESGSKWTNTSRLTPACRATSATGVVWL